MTDRLPFSVSPVPANVETYLIRMQKRVDGKRVDLIPSTRFAGKKRDALAKGWELYHAWKKGETVQRSHMTVKELCLAFNTRAVRGNISSKELDLTAQHFDNQIIPEFGGDDVQKLTTKRCADGLAAIWERGSIAGKYHKGGKPYADETRKKIYGHFRLALEYARVQLKVITSNPINDVLDKPVVKARKVKELPSPAQVESFLSSCAEHSPKLELYAYVIRYTGARLGEAMGLKVGSLLNAGDEITIEQASRLNDDDEYEISDGVKSEAGERSFGVSAVLVEKAKAYVAYMNARRAKIGLNSELSNEDPLFLNLDGSTDRNDTISKLLKKHMRDPKGANVKKGRAHLLRHFFASELIQIHKYDVLTVQYVMGHSTPQTTLNLYGHLFKKKVALPGHVDPAAAVEKPAAKPALKLVTGGSAQ